jgi:hypothetical protein
VSTDARTADAYDIYLDAKASCDAAYDAFLAALDAADAADAVDAAQTALYAAFDAAKDRLQATLGELEDAAFASGSGEST